MDRPIKVLLLTAGLPASGREFRKIQQAVKSTAARARVAFVIGLAVRPPDLCRYLRENKPHVVHFSVHGKTKEVVLVDDTDTPTEVDHHALTELLLAHSGQLQLVIVNSCFSNGLAQAISKHIDVAVGVPGSIDDDAAIAFSQSFYESLGDGGVCCQGLQAGRHRHAPEQGLRRIHARASRT